METNQQVMLQTLQKLINTMASERDLPMDLKQTFNEIKEYILRNYK